MLINTDLSGYSRLNDLRALENCLIYIAEECKIHDMNEVSIMISATSALIRERTEEIIAEIQAA